MSFFSTTMMAVCLFCSGCVKLPEGIQPIQAFDPERYLGKWYEIARLDHSFEKGLSHGTAMYKACPGGGISVENKGYDAQKKRWSKAEAKAYQVSSRDVGHLKVSFFWPIYASYVIFELDHEGYQYAFVTGDSRSYLWLLSRTPYVSDALKKQFVEKAKSLGFQLDKLIWVDQSPLP